VQNAVKGGIFVTGTMNLHFFVTGQIGMKFGNKTSITVLYWIFIQQFWKFALKGVIVHQTAIFGLLWQFSKSQAYRSGVTFFNLSKPSVY